MKEIILKKTEVINGIEFHLKTIVLTNGSTLIKTTVQCFSGIGNGFQISTSYQDEESIKTHLDKVKIQIQSIAESLSGWKTVIEKLEEEGYTQVTE